ncbi:hypothetical protein LEQ41_09535 [Streptococcus agalactiae]|nr:hypothetical protein [Streptococcus agalactiae]
MAFITKWTFVFIAGFLFRDIRVKSDISFIHTVIVTHSSPLQYNTYPVNIFLAFLAEKSIIESCLVYRLITS